MKALVPVCKSVETFPPGHYLWSKDGELKQWYKRDWMEYAPVEHNVSDKAELKAALEAAVKRQLMCDVPYGVLLSGGLDSSVISAITKLYAARRVEDDGKSEAWWPQLHSFAVGLEGSPDLAAARKVADHLGTIHHQIHFTVQEGLDALRDVIYHLETYDVTTIRASTPMYLMARYIKAMGIKMVLSGEGSDELFGGYLYFHKAPTPASSTKRTCASSPPCTSMTACGPTSPWPPGAWKAACPSSTRSSWTWRCASIPPTRCAARARSRSTSCGKPSRICSPRSGVAPEGAVLRRRRLLLD